MRRFQLPIGILSCLVLILSIRCPKVCAQEAYADGISDGMIAIDGQTPWLVYDQTRFGVGHTTGRGIGYTRDFTALEAFVPFVYSNGEGIIFSDARALLESDLGPRGLNLGIGHRFYSDELDGLIGTYLYYDYRETDRSSFQQLSPGFEILTDRWDFRMNAYIPAIFDDRQPIENRFVGNFLLIDRAEIAYTGVDAEFGLAIPALEQFHTRLYGGGYYFNASKGQDTLGWKARAETRLSGLLTLDLSVQNDELFDTTLNSTLTLRLPRNGLAGLFQRDQDHIEQSGVFSRLTDRVQRQQNIVVNVDDGVLALNPADDQPLDIQHVAGTGGPGADGTFEAPFGDLTDLLDDDGNDRLIGANADIIYVRPTSTPLMPANTIPTDGQLVITEGTQLLSNGPEQRVVTHLGEQELPFSNSLNIFQMLTPSSDPIVTQTTPINVVQVEQSSPVVCNPVETGGPTGVGIEGTITLPNSSAVTQRLPRLAGAASHDVKIRLETNVTLAGFDITGQVITGSVDATQPLNLTGLVIRNNIFRNDRNPNDTEIISTRIGLFGNITGLVQSNTIIGATTDQLNPEGKIEGAQRIAGIQLGGGSFIGEISGNRILSFGIGIDSTENSFGGNIIGNTIASNTRGINLTGEITGTTAISRNVFLDNDTVAIEMDLDGPGISTPLAITNNVFTDNARVPVAFIGHQDVLLRVFGDILNLELTGNSISNSPDFIPTDQPVCNFRLLQNGAQISIFPTDPTGEYIGRNAGILGVGTGFVP